MSTPDQDPWEFSCKRYGDVYEGHHDSMVQLNDEFPGALQLLLRDIYNNARYAPPFYSHTLANVFIATGASASPTFPLRLGGSSWTSTTWRSCKCCS